MATKKPKKGRLQFTVSVNPSLIGEVKIKAIKRGVLFSDVVERLFLEYLSRQGEHCACAAQQAKVAVKVSDKKPVTSGDEVVTALLTKHAATVDEYKRITGK